MALWVRVMVGWTFRLFTRGIYPIYGVVNNICKLMYSLRVPEIGYNGVWTKKATDFWREVTGAEIEDSAVRVSSPPLPREPVWIPAILLSRRL